jgi:hypothetical protein
MSRVLDHSLLGLLCLKANFTDPRGTLLLLTACDPIVIVFMDQSISIGTVAILPQLHQMTTTGEAETTALLVCIGWIPSVHFLTGYTGIMLGLVM